jgi:hypothetical protein
VVAALLAIILGPLVDLTERRLHLRRALATLLVFLVAIVALAGILTVFIRPLASEGPQFIDRIPGYVQQARTGRGPIGRLVQRYNLDEYVERNQARLRESANRLTTPALGVLRSIFSTVVALVTIFVLTFLMVLQGPKLLASWTAALPDHQQERVRRVAADCAKAVTGYMTGNLLISIIAGTVTYVVLWIMGVPYRGVVVPFVGFADLIPLVGATLGAVAAITVPPCTRYPPPSWCWWSSSSTSSSRTTSCNRSSWPGPWSCPHLPCWSASSSASSCSGSSARCSPSRWPESFMSSAATSTTATAAASSPNRPPGPTRSRSPSPATSNPVSSSPRTDVPTTGTQ